MLDHIDSLLVSPELSSGRDLVIQMSVRRVPSAVHVFLSGIYLGNHMTYLDDIWYVGGSRSEVAHAEFWAWQMPILINYAKIMQIRYLKVPNLHNLCKNLSEAFLGIRMPHLDDIWYVGRARAEGAHGDLDGGQRSSEVKWGKLCAMATIFGQKKP